MRPVKLAGNVTLTKYPPGLLAFMRARLDDGATALDLKREFGVSHTTVTAIRRKNMFSPQHVSALKRTIGDGFMQASSMALLNMTPEKYAAAPLGTLSLVACQMYDKYRLHEGMSTANVAVYDVVKDSVQGIQAAHEALKTISQQFDILGSATEAKETANLEPAQLDNGANGLPK